MYKYFIFLLIYLGLISCIDLNRQAEDDLYLINFQPLLKKEAEVLSLNQWGKKVQFIPLKDSASISIKSIQYLKQKGDKLLIVHSGKMSLFNLKGEYLYDIKEQDQRRNRKDGFILRNDTIFVSDKSFGFSLYNWDGEYLGKLFKPHIRHSTNFFSVPQSDVFLAHVNNFTGKKEIRLFFFRDTTVLKIIPNWEKYEPISPEVVYNIDSEMRPFDGTVSAFKEVFNDTIFKVDSALNLHPYAVVNLGKYKATKEAMFSCTAETLLSNGWDFFGNKIALTAIGETGDILYFTHYDMKNPYVYSFDKSTGKAFFQKIVYSENPFGFSTENTFVPRFISMDGKYLIDYEMSPNGGNLIIVLVER